MRLFDALKAIQQAPRNSAAGYQAFLACGFTPLHLKTFLMAHLQLAFPANSVEVRTGLYGDLVGNIERLARDRYDCGAVVMEWSDLDARLGLRSLAGWNHEALPDIAGHIRAVLDMLRDSIRKASQESALVLCLPTLPLPPIQYAYPQWSGSKWEWELQELISSFALWVATNTSAQILRPDWLHRASPTADRLDAKSALLDGFPYKLPHASAIAEGVVQLAKPRVPKKGIITDLDNTLWKGILGEIGTENVSWDFDQKSHVHALYQSMLSSLAKTGTLIAVASKNEPDIVLQALNRKDLILDKQYVFPLEVHWGPKSKSVTQILQTWNIGADSVVFIDDSELELAEVKTAHPKVDCLLFPSDPNAAYLLLETLRDQFAKPVTTEEDRLRLDSIRNRARCRAESGGANAVVAEDFLEQAGAVLNFSFSKHPTDPRVLELINKTNQFNLNGRRLTDSSLRDQLAAPETILLKVSYGDKFGALGKISALLGTRIGDSLRLDSWVLSCRAFSRRIEFACLAELFTRFSLNTIGFDFTPTDRNKPLQEFFMTLLGEPPQAGFSISRELFFARCPKMFHRVEETTYA